MNTITLEIASREQANRRFLRAFEGKQQGNFITFESPELLFKTLSGRRWQIVSLMTGAGSMTIREIARRMNRDVKTIHGDVHALLNTGILQKTEDNRIVFPYEALHVDFMLKEAA